MTKPHMMKPNGSPKVTKQIATEVAKHLPENVDADAVQAMMVAWGKVLGGDPVGTVKIDETTGAVAHRVEVNGVPMWRISNPDGATYQDAAAEHASLAWTQLFPTV